jgi:UDP-N-acetylglucosamine 4-epimerase
MKVLVTGGAGFIGSHICDYLIENGHQVKVIDNLSTGNKENIMHLLRKPGYPGFHFIKGDITNLDTVREACEDIDVICHQAAIGSVPRSINDPLYSHDSNVNGFLNVLIVAKEMGIKRVVYASSSSVYGDHPVLPKTEDNTGNCLSPYAVTKKIDELYASVWWRCYGVQTIGLRYFNVFGPRQNPSGAYAAVIPKFINNLENYRKCEIYGDGNYSRDFTYIDNVVLANYLALTTDNDESFGNVMNIGAGGRITISEMYNIIKEEMNSTLEPIYLDNRKGDIAHSNADISKAERLIGYRPFINFRDGIVKTIPYYAV